MGFLKGFLKDKGFISMIALEILINAERLGLVDKELRGENLETLTNALNLVLTALVWIIWRTFHHYQEKRATATTIPSTTPLQPSKKSLQPLFTFLRNKLHLSEYIQFTPIKHNQ